MLCLITDTGALVGTKPRLLHVSESDKVLVVERGPLVFFFNFHSSQSVSDYAVRVPPGKLRGVLNTDEPRFGGQGRIQLGQEYPLLTEMQTAECVFFVNVYLPCRTALVLQRK